MLVLGGRRYDVRGATLTLKDVEFGSVFDYAFLERLIVEQP